MRARKVILLEGPQAMPARLENNGMRMKTLQWSVVNASVTTNCYIPMSMQPENHEG
jgi:hypothetical protein